MAVNVLMSQQFLQDLVCSIRVAAASNTYFNIQNLSSCHTVLMFRLILTTMEHHASEHHLKGFFVKGKYCL